MDSSLPTINWFVLVQEEGQQTTMLAGDPGGWTNWGITQAKLSEWIGRYATTQDVLRLQLPTAAAILKRDYYSKVGGPAAWAGLDLMLTDHGFNAGENDSVRVIQRLLDVHVDGLVGDETEGAWNAVQDRRGFLLRVRTAQEHDYRTKGDFPLFGKEWIGDPDAEDDWRRDGRLGRRYKAALALVA